jgi:aminopeptidase N
MKFIIAIFFPFISICQFNFNRQDSLRGSINNERNWWDVKKYELTVQPDFETKTIQGNNSIYFEVLQEGNSIQIDLQQPLQIDSILFNFKPILFSREGNVYHLSLNSAEIKAKEEVINVYYSGKPKEAINAPWDGGWIWKKDEKGNPWMSVACQGLGASSWFPCKDHQSDEPENGALITIICPDSLVAVSNGKMIEMKSHKPGLNSTTWKVVNPINNYNIIPYIGKYVRWSETYLGEKGELTCDYWVLDYELDKAKIQFKQVPKMLKCFEYWFGPYPFYEDGYKLIQAPFLGMEHQSAIAYGNKFENGYLGSDLSKSGWGLKWDFIIVHESGHEWFGNNITSKDIADMWIHESFTNYSETIFTDCEFGPQAGNEYEIGLRKQIKNDNPIIGKYDVNNEGSGDMYYKGSNMIHMIRQVMNDDERFRQMLRGMNKSFYHKTVTTSEIENYINRFSGIDFSKVFDQYLRSTQIPIFEYKLENDTLKYRWMECVKGFDLKIRLKNSVWISPTENWQTFEGVVDSIENFLPDPNFYVLSRKIK